MSLDKRIRNVIYRVCGGLMVVFVVWTAIGGYMGKSIFWPEALALECFALSWLVKGRADYTVTYVAERVVNLARPKKPTDRF